MAWEDRRFGSADIYAQRLDGSGSPMWAADGAPVCTDGAGQARPAVTVCATGGAVVAWMDTRDDAAHAGTWYAPYVQRLDAGHAF